MIIHSNIKTTNKQLILLESNVLRCTQLYNEQKNQDLRASKNTYYNICTKCV